MENMGILDKAIREELDKERNRDQQQQQKNLSEERKQAEKDAAKLQYIPFIQQALSEFADACFDLGGGPVPLLNRRKPTFFNKKEYVCLDGYMMCPDTIGTDHRNNLLFLTSDGKYLYSEEFRIRSPWAGPIQREYVGGYSFKLSLVNQYDEVSADEAVNIIADYMFYVLDNIPVYWDPDAAERSYFAKFDSIRKAMRENNPEEAVTQAFLLFARNNVYDNKRLTQNEELSEQYAKLK